jgi:hypothetical protein
MVTSFADYKDFDDFCDKNKMKPVEGLRFLEKELEKLEMREINANKLRVYRHRRG